MATIAGDSSPRRLLDALFPEAREYERRRRRRHLLAALSCLVALAIVVGLHYGGDGSSAAVASPLQISSAALPPAGGYVNLAAVNGRLVLTGGQSLLLPEQVSAVAHGRVVGTCTAATLDPADLHMVSAARGNCGDPSLYGQRVLPVSYLYTRRAPLGTSGLTEALRIAIVAPGERDGYRLGPKLLEYSQCQGCNIEWTVGDGSLWVYAPWATPKITDRGEALQISEQTGQVLQRWSVPSFQTALLAVDRDGFWISPRQRSCGAYYSGVPDCGPARAEIPIYRVAPGLHTPQRIALRGWGPDWLVASGHSLWLDEAEGTRPRQLWRVDDVGGALSARLLPSSAYCAKIGEQSVVPMTGSLGAGIYCQSPPIQRGSPALPLERLDPATGAGHPIRVPAVMASSATLGHSVYFLGSRPSGPARTRVYRIASR